MAPKVSVVIPTYNRAKTLLRAIDSILAQTFQDFEIIVVDDCSNDNTDDVMRAMTDSRIRYIRHKVNLGGAEARNSGVKVGLGEYIAFLDSDDEWVNNKLELQVARLRELGDGFDVVYSWFNVVNMEGRLLRKNSPDNRGDIFLDLLVSNCIGTLSSVVVRRSVLSKISGFDKELRSCQDWDFYLQLARNTQFEVVKCYLVNYTESYGFARISSRADAVLSGHYRIEKKYSDYINKLPLEKLSRRMNYVGRIMIAGGAFREGTTKICEAYIRSGNLIAFVKSLVFLLKSYFRKWISTINNKRIFL